MRCTCCQRRVFVTQSILSMCISGVQCACSTCVMSLHMQDTVCAARMHLEAVRGAISTKPMCSICTSGEHWHECSGCAANVQGVCSEHAPSVRCTFRECTSGMRCTCSEPTPAAQCARGACIPVCGVRMTSTTLLFSARAVGVRRTCGYFPRSTERR